jgi:hypothetical protein
VAGAVPCAAAVFEHILENTNAKILLHDVLNTSKGIVSYLVLRQNTA